MRIISRKQIEDSTANPTAEALNGYNLNDELVAAVRGALKPLHKRLQTYRSERARLQSLCDRWSPDAYATKLDEITARAHSGDIEAETAIESGAIPSKQSYSEMHNRACRDLENFDLEHRALFREVLPLIGAPMTKAVDQGQEILDAVLNGCGVPRFELFGWRNHISYVLLQLEHASRNESADLEWFWQAAQ